MVPPCQNSPKSSSPTSSPMISPSKFCPMPSALGGNLSPGYCSSSSPMQYMTMSQQYSSVLGMPACPSHSHGSSVGSQASSSFGAMPSSSAGNYFHQHSPTSSPRSMGHTTPPSHSGSLLNKQSMSHSFNTPVGTNTQMSGGSFSNSFNQASCS